jgi:triose/dihydroxyacetone kinase / FAD-AMP lyase (cyclizing)
MNSLSAPDSRTYPDSTQLRTAVQDIKVVYTPAHDPRHVACISGGGSGHEPAHAGYVGPGMLAAAVCGDIFASPSSCAVYEAIMKVAGAGAAGCLLIVKNYTGDRLNFGMAAEMAKCDGVAVEMVVVADDCGVEVPGISGQRGIAGTVFVHKVRIILLRSD